MKNIELPKRGRVFALIIGVVLVFTGAYCNLHGIRISVPQSGLVVPFLLLGIWGFVPAIRFPKWLTCATFAIFLLHMPIYKILGYVCPMKIESISQWIGKWTIGWGGSLLLALSIGRFCPKIARVLFGGRTG